MDFDLSDEQRLLKESVERLMTDRYGFEQRRAYAKEPDGWSTDLWGHYAELGLLGLSVDERHGGSGRGPIETMIVMEAFGRGLILEPYFATAVLGAGLVRRAGSDAQQAVLLPKVADGSLKLAFAQLERHSRGDLAEIATRATQSGSGWTIEGAKSLVLHGDVADTLIASARISGGQRDRGGIGLFLVDARAPGVSRRGYPTQDGLRAAEIGFEGAPAELLGDAARALSAMERVADEAKAALCAEAVGVLAAAH